MNGEHGIIGRIEQDYLADRWPGVDYIALSWGAMAALTREEFRNLALFGMPVAADRPSFPVRARLTIPDNEIWLIGPDGQQVRIITIGEDTDAAHP